MGGQAATSRKHWLLLESQFFRSPPPLPKPRQTTRLIADSTPTSIQHHLSFRRELSDQEKTLHPFPLPVYPNTDKPSGR
jgi:hypothetical protein